MTPKNPRPKPPSWPAQSPQTVLIRNLQLLELDQLGDWPGITPRTLSPSSQNQRQRIKAVEWVLYQLVVLWDPETARDKLRPFFPPLEPLQSVNLRAALFRVLSDLKKNGDLGRETILRKSMLDDCKGEKFDELLASFSTAVVRKIKAGYRNPAIDLSTARGLTPQEYPLILPLILAHRVSLKSSGERRDRVRNTHKEFSQLLERKRDELNSRPATDNHALLIQEADLAALARETKENWQGSVEWADALLYGGLSSGRDAFLELPFESAWSQAKESTVDELHITTTRPDLVMDLESRVLRQRARLQRWRQYTASLKHSASEPSPALTSANKKGPPLVFRDHQTLTIASISKVVRQPVVERASSIAKDRSLLMSVSEAMDRINASSSSLRKQAPISPPVPEPELKAEPELEPELEVQSTQSPLSQIPTIQAPEPIPETYIPEPTKERNPPTESNTPDYNIDIDAAHFNRRNTYTLVERTRKSMSLVPPPRENPRPRPRSSRMSFPVNQFETPPRSSMSHHLEEAQVQAQTQASDFPSRASTPRDELFDDQADYASVFKSRPRIALSPITSPAVHVSPIGDFDLSMDSDPGAAEDLDMVAVGSPLASRKRF